MHAKTVTVLVSALYTEYMLRHDHFGRGGNEVTHRLRAIRDRASAREEAAWQKGSQT
jgi:hypothetical protein